VNAFPGGGTVYGIGDFYIVRQPGAANREGMAFLSDGKAQVQVEAAELDHNRPPLVLYPTAGG
jgi:hypothetical protein